MSLTVKLADQFSHNARIEGERLQQAGRVKITDHTAGWIEATVQGTMPYEMILERQKGVVRYSCDCPYFVNTGDTCKHVWATLRQAELKGYLDEWDTSRTLEMVPDDEQFAEDDLALG